MSTETLSVTPASVRRCCEFLQELRVSEGTVVSISAEAKSGSRTCDSLKEIQCQCLQEL